MDCVKDCGYDNLSLLRVMARVFSLKKHSSQYVDNVGIYSVCRDMVYQIWQNSKIECFADILQEGFTREILAKTSCHHLSWLFTFQLCAEHMSSFCGKSSRELPAKTPLIFNDVLSLHTLSHTQPIQRNPTNNIGYIRLNRITIKFDTELKPTQNSCKSQLYMENWQVMENY